MRADPATNRATPTRHRLTPLLWAVAGTALSVLFVVGVGILTFQRSGVSGGAVYGMSNELVGVTTPNPGFLHLAGIVALGVLVVGVLTVAAASRPPRSRLLLRAGFAVTTAALIVTSVSLLLRAYAAEGIPQSTPLGWNGWIQVGGSTPVVGLVLLLVGGVVWRDRQSVAAAVAGTEADAAARDR